MYGEGLRRCPGGGWTDRRGGCLLMDDRGPIVPRPTPNPNALKFDVGAEVGGPRSYTAANAADDPAAEELFGIDGVMGVFMTADFVTVTKAADADWSAITPQARAILERYYPGRQGGP